MLIEIYIEALLVNEDLADRVRLTVRISPKRTFGGVKIRDSEGRLSATSGYLSKGYIGYGGKSNRVQHISGHSRGRRDTGSLLYPLCSIGFRAMGLS